MLPFYEWMVRGTGRGTGRGMGRGMGRRMGWGKEAIKEDSDKTFDEWKTKEYIEIKIS